MFKKAGWDHQKALSPTLPRLGTKSEGGSRSEVETDTVASASTLNDKEALA
jgi:hypothetical protein